MIERGAHSAVVVSGGGRYADPWHPFEETSAILAGILRGLGYFVETRNDVDAALAELDQELSLLVVNVGECADGVWATAPTVAARAGLRRYLAWRGPVLAMHSAASAFPDLPEWEEMLGARWVTGTTMHPDIGPGLVTVYPQRHVITAGASDFDVCDELYSYLRLGRDVVPLASHRYNGVEHPLLWARQWHGSRVVYDALGHDRRSFDSLDHVSLIAGAARWLVGDLDSAKCTS